MTEHENHTPSPVERPSDVSIVAVLVLLSGLASVITGVAFLIDAPEGAVGYLAWASLLIGLGTAALGAMLFMGSRLARTVIAVFMVFNIVVHAWHWFTIGSDAAVAAMIAILISGVGLLLLYTRESSAYLTGVKK